MKLAVGHFKQELIKDYNELNLRMFDIGVKSQKIDIVGDKILISAYHKRIPSLKHLDGINRLVTRLTDVAIIDSHKELFKELVERKYGMKVVSILKDYDPFLELAVTIIILDQDVNKYIANLVN